ncbi:MAG TPA: PHP domain-containing protein [Streptosporangiaceae bacterium]
MSPAIMSTVLAADNHVHTQWSYDTDGRASMAAACEHALAIGVPAVAFTEHLDFTTWAAADPIAATGLADARYDAMRPLDLSGYLECVADCRRRYPDLRIRSGVEAGEPHLFAASLKSLLGAAPLDRVLGSLHAVVCDGRLTDVDGAYEILLADELMRRYLAELARLVDGSDLFEVLGHLDYPRRAWPAAAGRFDEAVFEEEYRTVLRALAASDRVLEINTSSPLASVALLGWWRDEGGRAISFGSDAHLPWHVGQRFALAADIAEAAGFRAPGDPSAFWRS